jgi:hypothetical protein
MDAASRWQRSRLRRVRGVRGLHALCPPTCAKGHLLRIYREERISPTEKFMEVAVRQTIAPWYG